MLYDDTVKPPSSQTTVIQLTIASMGTCPHLLRIKQCLANSRDGHLRMYLEDMLKRSKPEGDHLPPVIQENTNHSPSNDTTYKLYSIQLKENDLKQQTGRVGAGKPTRCRTIIGRAAENGTGQEWHDVRPSVRGLLNSPLAMRIPEIEHPFPIEPRPRTE
jgi:hypothetical protein